MGSKRILETKRFMYCMHIHIDCTVRKIKSFIFISNAQCWNIQCCIGLGKQKLLHRFGSFSITFPSLNISHKEGYFTNWPIPLQWPNKAKNRAKKREFHEQVIWEKYFLLTNKNCYLAKCMLRPVLFLCSLVCIIFVMFLYVRFFYVFLRIAAFYGRGVKQYDSCWIAPFNDWPSQYIDMHL